MGAFSLVCMDIPFQINAIAEFVSQALVGWQSCSEDWKDIDDFAAWNGCWWKHILGQGFSCPVNDNFCAITSAVPVIMLRILKDGCDGITVGSGCGVKQRLSRGLCDRSQPVYHAFTTAKWCQLLGWVNWHTFLLNLLDWIPSKAKRGVDATDGGIYCYRRTCVIIDWLKVRFIWSHSL